MAFSPIQLPIEEILLTNFIPDIATISNANDIILKDKLEDLINQFEIDINTLSIGVDNPINSVKTNNILIENSLLFQISPIGTIIARLEKDSNDESVFTVDNLNVSNQSQFEEVELNTLSVNTTLVSNSVETENLIINSQVVESKETVLLDLVRGTSPTTDAVSTLTLTSASKQNIFVKLKAVTSPTLDAIYDGVSDFISINTVVLNIDFDQNNPPSENSVFNIYFVDIVDEFTNTSIIPALVGSPLIPFTIRGGQNQSTSTPIILHNGLYEVGINPGSTNFAGSDVLKSNVPTPYGHSLGVLYILDENLADRLVITNMVGMEFF